MIFEPMKAIGVYCADHDGFRISTILRFAGDRARNVPRITGSHRVALTGNRTWERTVVCSPTFQRRITAMTINAENAVLANYVGGWLAEASQAAVQRREGLLGSGLTRSRSPTVRFVVPRPRHSVWIGWKPGASLRLMTEADEWALGHVAVRAIFNRDVRGHMVHTHTCRDDRRVATTAVRTYLTVHRGCHSHALELPTAKSPGDPKPVTRRSNWTAGRSERLLCRWGSCAPMSAAGFWTWAGTGDPSRRQPLTARRIPTASTTLTTGSTTPATGR
jgi:hypothetical protein